MGGGGVDRRGKIHYLVAIIFQQPIDLEEAAASSPLSEVSSAPAAAEPQGGAREEDQARALAEQRVRYEALLAESMKAAGEQQARALAEQQAHYEALLAELTKVVNDQQAEFRQLLEQQATAAKQERADLDRAVRDLESQLSAAERRCAADETRHTALRREAETLVSLLTSPLRAETAEHDTVTSFKPAGASAHAVA